MTESLKILMLEDSNADAEMIQRLLQKEKFICEFALARDKKSFLQTLARFHPDIILSDHSLPQFNSVEALAIVREQFPDIPVIIVTGTVSEEFAAEIIKSGADDYLLKDRLARLPNAIIQTIQRRKSEIEKQEREQKIRQSEANLRTIFENTSEGVLLLNTDAVVVAFNSKAANYTLYSGKKEIKIGESIYDCIEEDRVIFLRRIISIALSGESIQYERSYEKDNGKITWIDFYVAPVIETGHITGICVTGRDITEKKIIEQEREFDRNNVKALINNTHDLMWSVDTDFRLITSNDAFDKMVQYMSGTTVTKGSDVLVNGFTEKQLTRFRNYYKRAFAGESFTEVEYSDNPTDFWSEISFYPIYNRDKITGAACFSHDITWRKKAEKEITDYKNALDQSSIVAVTDQYGIIKHVNSNFCRVSGYSVDELLGTDHHIINCSVGPGVNNKYLWTTIESGNIWRGEFCSKTKSGAIYWVDTTIVPFLDAKGKPVQYIEISNDITGRKLMEQEIIDQKIQEQKKIARAIIKTQEKERNYIGQELHDNINQLLVGAKIYLLNAGTKSQEVNQLITYPTDLIDKTIEEIRLLSSRLVTPLKDFNLDELVQKLLDDFNKDQTIKTIFDYDLSETEIGTELKLNIFRTVQEQLNNIAKHAHADNVAVSIRAQNGLVSVTVADDGQGFNIDTKRNGIGISNIMNRVASFNGEVFIESSPGNGCKVSFTIPVCNQFKDVSD
ncbi:MAG: PAS domain S-box protein [Bacteroidota bacterium]